MNACERGSLCSFVKPCGLISLSNAGLGEGPVASDFDFRAVFSKFIEYIVENWFWWHAPHTAGSIFVTGRDLTLATCASMPS